MNEGRKQMKTIFKKPAMNFMFLKKDIGAIAL